MQTTLWTKCLQIEKLGQPNDVLILCTIPLNPKKWNENAALIRWIASPINLSDLNIIKGKYEEINNLNNLPCIGGTEGVGLVERIGSNVQHLCVGDLVININYWLNNNQNKIELNNIWTEWDIIPSNLLISIDKRINLASAATLGIIPPIAWTLLNDFIKLEKGDWIVQNAANSEIGKNIIQLAKAFGYFTINLIEDREDLFSLKNELYSLGANKVFTEKELFNEIINKKQKQLLIRLALNNGNVETNSSYLSMTLGYNGVFVTFDGINNKLIKISSNSFIFNKITAYGFSLFNNLKENNQQKIKEMFDQLQLFIIEGKLKEPKNKIIPLARYKEGIENTLESGIKQILMISENVLNQKGESKI